MLSSCSQGHDEIVWAVEVAGHRLFSASADKTIRVWDIESRRCERVLEDHTRPVLSLACADGKLFSGSYDYSIKVGSAVHPALSLQGQAGYRSVACERISVLRLL
jgi:WD40 repeat protein